MDKKTTNATAEPAKKGPGRPKKTTTTPTTTPPSTRPTTPSLDSSQLSEQPAPTTGPKLAVPPISVPLASELENPKPVRPTRPDPLEPASRDELRNATIEAIAKQQAAAAAKRVSVSATEAAKVRKEFAKEVENSEFMFQQKAELCYALNLYRQKYASVLNYPFKKEYSVDMDYAVLQSTKQQIELLLNTQHAPSLLKDAMIKISELLELGSTTIGYPYLNLSGFKDAMVANAQTGLFDEELEQLAIKYGNWFNLPPEKKLAGKVALIAVGKVTQNASEYQNRIAAASINRNVTTDPRFSGL